MAIIVIAKDDGVIIIIIIQLWAAIFFLLFFHLSIWLFLILIHQLFSSKVLRLNKYRPPIMLLRFFQPKLVITVAKVNSQLIAINWVDLPRVVSFVRASGNFRTGNMISIS